MKFYLAGKISYHGWRTHICPGIRDATPGDEIKTIIPEHTCVGPYFISCDHGCCHGDTTHGAGFGCGCGSDLEEWVRNKTHAHNFMGRRSLVSQMCLEAIEESDVVFAWIDSDAVYGTIAEIGYARGLNKPVYIAYDKKFMDVFFKRPIVFQSVIEGVLTYTPIEEETTHEMWFLDQMATRVGIYSSPEEAFHSVDLQISDGGKF